MALGEKLAAVADVSFTLWRDRFFQKKNEPVPAFMERRQAYRLPLAGVEFLQLEIIDADGEARAVPLYNLSAGGFCFITGYSPALSPNSSALISLRLPLAEHVIVQTTVRILECLAGSAGAGLYRCQFDDSLTEEEREYIHRYVLLKQLDWLRKFDPEDAESVH